MTGKIFRSILTAVILVLLATALVCTAVQFRYTQTQQRQRLRDELKLVAAAAERLGVSYLEEVDPGSYRLTLVAATGEVLYDSAFLADELENHQTREEIEEALLHGKGSSARYSSTRTELTLNEALRLQDGSVLRLSVSVATGMQLLINVLLPQFLVLTGAVFLCAALAGRMAERIVQPLNNLNLEQPLENDTYEELAPLLGRLHQLHGQVEAQLTELRQKTDEFALITGNMTECLVLLGSRQQVLSMNPAAQALFQADAGCIGSDFLVLTRSIQLQKLLQDALQQGHSEVRIELSGRQYQFDCTRIDNDHQLGGAVLLGFDVTALHAAEQQRREFTANVSHELKTPLQSILGSAELLESGLVKQEDLPRFAGLIRTQATRLLALIQDIIRLSQLEGDAELPRERVALLPLAQEVFAVLQEAADKRGVTLQLAGEDVSVFGVRQLLFETVYNLCDNAIRYSKDGGAVSVQLAQQGARAVLTVSDNGIGIPPQDQARVFERFYRVDKSHSRESGGTGLGLSIVKHAVQYHGGSIRLDSKLGEGSRFTVSLPLEGRENREEPTV